MLDVASQKCSLDPSCRNNSRNGVHLRQDPLTVGFHYAGKADLHGWKRRRPFLADIKTGNPQPWHADQLVLYEHILRQTLARQGVKAPKRYELGIIYLSLTGGYVVTVKQPPTIEEILNKAPPEYHTSLDPHRTEQEYTLQFDPVAHAYYLLHEEHDPGEGKQRRDIIRIPGVSELLDAAGRKKKYKSSSKPNPFAEFGTKIHEWLEAIHNGVDANKALADVPDKQVRDVLATYLDHWDTVVRREKIVVWNHETLCWGHFRGEDTLPGKKET